MTNRILAERGRGSGGGAARPMAGAPGRRILVCIALLCALTGCAAPPPAPAPRVETVYVPVERQSDARMPETPRFAVDELAIGAAPAEKMRMCYVEREQRKAYERTLVGELQKCW